ncbi:MAG TPA: tail fiber protein [Leptospiraceae bacterium]|nr:tail fiber protein [Leptospiraceae bacterium]HMY66518.1 tail fiber protein [Leptospiraceae bacterium]HNF12622.1 tail fiber protein [Leptospiraceae bacterium]
MKKGFAGGVGFTVGVFGVAVLSVSVTLNTFTSGTPINAAKVNENFANLKTAVESINEVPVGTIIAYGGINAPSGWFICDGTPVSRTAYSALYGVIGINFGAGDGSTTFHLPDLRHRFLRGWDNQFNSNRDMDAPSRTVMNSGGGSGAQLGSVQDDELKSHTHGLKKADGNTTGGGGNAYTNVYSVWPISNDVIMAYGGSETRPKNAYVNFIIKY